MKIRTFLTCQELNLDRENDRVEIHDLFYGVECKSLPNKISMVIFICVEEITPKDKQIEIALLSPKEKLLKKWTKEFKNGSEVSAVALKVSPEFVEEGMHFIKVTANNEFLGKYTLMVEVGENNA